jgi:hypothetical protein
MLSDEDRVVMYQPDTDEGFFYVPRETGDDDIIRRPALKTTTRLAAD